MGTITKKELIDRIAEQTGTKRVIVKQIIQKFLDQITDELGRGNRLEFRDFGVFESKYRAARVAQNPKTLERVEVPSKQTVKFKIGRLMKAKLSGNLQPKRSAASLVGKGNPHSGPRNLQPGQSNQISSPGHKDIHRGPAGG